ncbi:MAG TPA: AAA family ATPase [Syntrophorhabdaceae bacterium]|jgi:chromosome segregation protein
MKLSRLELFGFKSFCNRTVFQFGEGITSIVGPNGCGKSNVVDAIIWALGERGTKTLRIKDMGDVIFHGSNGKKSMSVGEVAIEFRNIDQDTIIKRRIYRDGVNEYYLNGNQVRLKDIQDFFLGTGIGLNSYAIIEQGKIEYFIQMKPQERKIVIEETSGVTRFEEKKREAMVRLEEVGVNLERVEDISREVAKSLEKAEREWERWKEYKVLADSLSEAEKWILVDGFGKLAKRIGKIEERGVDLVKEIEKKDEETAALKEEQESKNKEFALVDQTIHQLEVDIKGQEKDMESRLLEIDYLKEEEKRLLGKRAALARHQAELEEKILRLGEEGKALEEKKVEEEALLRKGEEEEGRIKAHVAELKAELEAMQKHMEEERVTLFVCMSRLTEIKNNLAEIERKKEEARKREERKQVELAGLREKLRGLTDKHTVLKAALEKERAEKTSFDAQEKKALEERDGLSRALQEKRGKIEQLKGARRGKEEFIRQMRSLQGVKEENPLNRSKLIDLVRVEEGAEKALERFFFKEMEYYVLNEKDVKTVAGIVEKHEGNYIFFPPQGMFTRTDNDIAMEVKWVETVEEALSRIGEGEQGVFINNHACVDSRGFILREKESKKVDLKSYRERVKAEKELKEIIASLERELSSLKEAEAAHLAGENRLREYRVRREGMDRKIAGLEREAVALETEQRTVRERLHELETRVELFEEKAGPTAEELLAEKALRETEKTRIEAAMAALKEKTDGKKKVHDETLSRWHQATINLERKRNLIKTLADDRARKAALTANLSTEKAGAAGKMHAAEGRAAERAGKVEALEASYMELKGAVERQVQRYEELKTASGAIHMERRALEEKAEALSKEIARIRSRKEGIEKEILVLTEKRLVIEERLKEIYHIEDAATLAIPTGEDFENEREKLAGEIEAIGEVNFRAEKEYLELKERALFLAQQMEDLKNAADSLKKTITKIENLTREIFFETFETVNTAFKKFTETLFKGGKGYLHYNPDIGGIDMYVQPPGKKVARMEQLSGGEKALISLSFLLSLIDTKPSPFVLMDEIDAPLDDANLISLMEIIREMSAKTQIAFITHNRITMEASHTIYGVTMEEEGISKIISVKL